MQIFIQVKQAGKKKNILDRIIFDVSGTINTLEDLLRSIILKRVDEFNHMDTFLMCLLSNQQILEQGSVGKVNLNVRFNDTYQEPEKAVEIALQSFRDGLFIVLVNDKQYESLEQAIELKEGDTLIFIKLTMLAGRLW